MFVKKIFGDEKKLELKEVMFKICILLLKNGDIDVIIVIMIIMEECKKEVDFLDVYFKVG